jgi:U3 small nucleolar RNA-associated protein 19
MCAVLWRAQAFAARHRAQFFRLADVFLSSTLVPAYTVAAFAKRFARLALGAPPSGALVAIAFVHNLIR